MSSLSPPRSTALGRRFRLFALIACGVGPWLGSCVGLHVAARGTAVDEQIRTAKAIGAAKCAPQDLAVAEANVSFAEIELGQGNDQRAADHMALASKSIETAVKNSWPCAPDTDKDGVPDIKDKCPLVPGPKEN